MPKIYSSRNISMKRAPDEKNPSAEGPTYLSNSRNLKKKSWKEALKILTH